ncbi:HET-domain-containing protein [Corynespora cassiicola Philippines]|uniref:HET-domain-containing protein n=1 Tax=Corynespora cassiicola Philippines TaxID=1448308 RepID=A0A2T2NGV8_CORCC|nr:HET-domain-containing protein [Corynespora cassiicola Philippines]
MIMLRCIEWVALPLEQMKELRLMWFSKAIDGRKRCILYSRGFKGSLELMLDGVPNGALPGNTGSLSTSEQIKRWFDTCIKQHDACNSVNSCSSDHAAPIRYLDIENDPILLTKPATSIEYACLSHCWGSGEHIFKTQRSNLMEHKSKGIFVDRLPKTFQDAIQICHNMDVKYLWIDSLCIVQDDDDDWNVQAAHMAGVYEGALFTIAASKAHDSSQGCFTQTKRRYLADILPGISGVKIRFLLPRVLDSDGITGYSGRKGEDHPLYQRGWCLQEQLLSRRILHFGAEEVIWECMSSMSHESNPVFNTKKNSLLSLVPSSNGETSIQLYWYRLVEEYSRRSLTFHKDKLPAISAIARKLQQNHPNSRYIAGLWQETLLEDLLWRAAHPNSQLCTSDDSKVPSWSWASISGEVKFIEPQLFSIAEIINKTFITEVFEMTGRTKEAKILLKAPLLNLGELVIQTIEPQLRSVHHPTVLLTILDENFRNIDPWGIFWDYSSVSLRNGLENEIEKDLWVMIIGLTGISTRFRVKCLVLKKHHNMNTYSRVGFVVLQADIYNFVTSYTPSAVVEEFMRDFFERMEKSEVILI